MADGRLAGGDSEVGSAAGLRLMHLLAKLLAKAAIAAHEAKVGEERGSRDKQTGEEEPAGAAIRIAVHLAEADGDQERRRSREHGEGRERIAMDGGGARGQPRGCARDEHRDRAGEENAGREATGWRGRIGDPRLQG